MQMGGALTRLTILNRRSEELILLWWQACRLRSRHGCLYRRLATRTSITARRFATYWIIAPDAVEALVPSAYQSGRPLAQRPLHFSFAELGAAGVKSSAARPANQ